MSALPSPLNVVIEQAISALLKMDTDTRERLLSLDGKVVQLNISRPELSVVLSIVDQQVLVIGQTDTPADTTINTSFSALRSLANRKAHIDRRDIKIEGDIRLGKQIRDIVSSVDPDWQEALSPFFGDTLVHQISVVGKSLSTWLDRTHSSMRQNTSEYLQEEIEVLAPNSEVKTFCIEVDELRAHVDRLNARLNRIEQRRTRTSGSNTC